MFSSSYALVNDPDGETRATALHFAAANGHIDCVTLLRGAVRKTKGIFFCLLPNFRFRVLRSKASLLVWERLCIALLRMVVLLWWKLSSMVRKKK